MESELNNSPREKPVREPRKGGKVKRPGIPDLGDRILKLMGTKSLSWLHDETGVSTAYLSRITRNEMTNPTLDIVLSISDALNVTISDLIGQTEPNQKEVREPRNNAYLPRKQLRELTEAIKLIESVIDQTKSEDSTLPEIPIDDPLDIIYPSDL